MLAHTSRSKAQPPGKESEADESWFTTFFAAQNTQLFKVRPLFIVDKLLIYSKNTDLLITIDTFRVRIFVKQISVNENKYSDSINCVSDSTAPEFLYIHI